MINKLNAKNGTYAIESPMCQKHIFCHTLSNPGKRASLLTEKAVSKVGRLDLKTQTEATVCVEPENTKGGSITVPLTSCLTGLESAA
jgi:hypothetical protein